MLRTFTISALAFSLLLIGLAPAASANVTLFTEDWSHGGTGWTYTGTGIQPQCNANQTQCSLEVSPPCCSAYATADHALDLDVYGRYVVDFTFEADMTVGDTDSWIQVNFDHGWMLFAPTEGINNGLTFQTDGGSSTNFGHNTLINQFAHFRMIVDTYRHQATGYALDSHGNVTRESSPMPVQATVSKMTGIRIGGVTWGNRNDFHYGAISIAQILQHVEGDSGIVVLNKPITDAPQRIVLDDTSVGLQHAKLTWTSVVPADLDLHFYDSVGRQLNAPACATLLTASESCLVPEGAQFATVDGGTSVQTHWTFEYS